MNISIQVKIPSLELFDSQRFVREIDVYMRNHAIPDIRFLFNSTTQGWKTRPRFFGKTNYTRYRMEATVYTTNKNYVRLNAGALPHIIRPRKRNRGGFLSFRTGYLSSTSPRSLTSRAYQRSGEYVSAQTVQHPGFDAREFDETVAEAYRPSFEENVQNAIDRAASKYR